MGWGAGQLTAVGLLSALVFLAGAFAIRHLRPEARDPILRAARASLADCGPFQFTRDLEIVSRRESLRGTVVVYKGFCTSPLGGRQLIYGFVTVDEDGAHPGGWARAQDPEPDELAEVGASSGCATLEDGRTECDASAWGRVLSPDVHSIEVAYGNGQVDRFEPAGEFFASVASGTEEVREVRLLDADGEVLRRYPMSW